MRKNATIWITGFIVISLVIYISFRTYRLVRQQHDSKIRTEVIPDLPLLNLDSTAYRVSPRKNQFLLIIFFNPSCEYCQAEAREIKSKIDRFSGSSVLMISSSLISEIRTFAKEYSLQDNPVVTFAKINPNEVFKSFGSLSIPHTFIYGKDKQLIREFKGEASVDIIIKYLE